MAYMTSIDGECRNGTCKKRATHSVFNRQNSSYGDYCKKHAKGLVANLNEYEERNRLTLEQIKGQSS